MKTQYIYRIPRCSSRILHPSRIRITPPASSAFDLYFVPNIFPIFTPAAERVNVVTPIKDTAAIRCTFRNAKVIPTARASILVATARRNMVLMSSDSFSSSHSPEQAYLIILAQMIPSRINAIQWSMAVILSRNWTPRK